MAPAFSCGTPPFLPGTWPKRQIHHPGGKVSGSEGFLLPLAGKLNQEVIARKAVLIDDFIAREELMFDLPVRAIILYAARYHRQRETYSNSEETSMKRLARLARVKMRLHHVLYVSYLVPASQVRPHVPDMLSLSTAAGDRVFVSVVSMSCNGVRMTAFPWPAFNYSQLNIRTYVKDPQTGKPAVCFLHSGVSSTIVSALTRVFGMSWQKVAFELQANQSRDGGYSDYLARGNWKGDINIRAGESDGTGKAVEPFQSRESLIDHLTAPLIGFGGPRGNAKRFEIIHRPLEVRAGELRSIQFELLRSMNLMDEAAMEKPHNVLLAPQAEFTVCLPPGRVTKT